MSTPDAAGALLVAGFVTFLTGAAWWRPGAYQQALPHALVAMAAEPGRLRWIQSWMMVGIVTTSLGIVLLSRFLDERGDGGWSTLGAALFVFGAVPMVASLTFGLTVRAWAAASTVATGEVPPVYEALDRWASLLMAIHMVTAYTSWAMLGAALVRTGTGPAWLGWSGVVAGCALATGFVALRGGPFAPPILVHVFPLAIGIALVFT